MLDSRKTSLKFCAFFNPDCNYHRIAIGIEQRSYLQRVAEVRSKTALDRCSIVDSLFPTGPSDG